jgi:hypothetical protein
VKNKQEITAVINNYFKGSYDLDETQMRAAFCPNATICGFFDDNLIGLSVEDFITHVIHQDVTKKYDKEILSIEICHNIAVVKTKVLVGEIYFTDIINLIKKNNGWVIRHKAFTNASS